jgi:hypothetical protein
MTLGTLSRILLLAALFAVQGVVDASLLSAHDLDTPGDKLLTFDSKSGLEWLDVPLTLGLSPNQVLSGAGGIFRAASVMRRTKKSWHWR